MDRLVRIHGDVFDVADRLRGIDEGYYPVYNLTRHRYEVHHAEQSPSLCVVVPYPALDSRTVDYVRETQTRFALERARSMDEYNRRLDEARETAILDEMSYKARHLTRHLDTTRSVDVPDYGRL